MVQKRSKNLDEAGIKEIVEILDGWSGKLTWDLFIDAIKLRTYNEYTRQTLHKHERIRNAFDLKKQDISNNEDNVRTVSSPELQKALERIARLEAENKRLESENSQLLEQFVRWAYNASTRELDHNFLNKPLPPVNRR